MLMDFRQILNQGHKIKNVIHVGAHYGEEVPFYKENGSDCILFEPHPDSYSLLENKFSDDESVILVNKALGSKEETKTLNIETANEGQSSSMLKPDMHLKYYPHIVFEDTKVVDQITLDSYMRGIDNREEYNFINIDVQGYELEVFKGADQTLNHVDYIMSEVNWESLYEDCVMMEDLDKFLENYGFRKIYLVKTPYGWGDAFYEKV